MVEWVMHPADLSDSLASHASGLALTTAGTPFGVNTLAYGFGHHKPKGFGRYGCACAIAQTVSTNRLARH
jgi:hypothetical protein